MTAVRSRLGVATRNDFARRLGLREPTYFQWETKDSVPAMATLKRAVKQLGVWGARDLAWWLADGEDDPPAWLEDDALDPYTAPVELPPGRGPRGVPAMPLTLLEPVRRELRGAVESAGPASLKVPVTRAYSMIEEWVATQEASLNTTVDNFSYCEIEARPAA